MARGMNIVLLSFSILAAVVIMSQGGGLLDYTLVDFNDKQKVAEANQIVNDIENKSNQITITNPISSLAAVFGLMSSILSMAWNLDSMFVLLGMPSWLATPLKFVIYPIIAILVMNVLNRNTI